MNLKKPKPKFGQRTPPAIFSPIFGLLGLGLAWRRAAETFAMPEGLADLILGGATPLFLFALAGFVVKVFRRPAVLAEDLRVLPSRAGIVAMVLSLYLMAATLTRIAPLLATGLLYVALVLHLGLAVLMITLMMRGPVEQRVVTPVWQIAFVGFIIGAMAALPLADPGLPQMLLMLTVPVAAAIWAVSLVQLIRKRPPATMRPFLAIHLAPACLFTIVASGLGMAELALWSGYLAIALFTVLVLAARFLTVAGFSPAFSAFTFPLAAFSTAMQVLANTGQGELFRILGGLSLVAATLIIPVITWKVSQAWVKGQLAVKTNAAMA